MGKEMEIVPSGEVQRQFGLYSDEAMIRPVGVSKNGRVRFVMVPIDEYRRLRSRDRISGAMADLPEDILAALLVAQPSAESIAVEARLAES